MFDPHLIEKINRGGCFALVGAGPSAEMGYPSWQALAVSAHRELHDAGKITDEASYEKHLKERKYPELFRQIERDLGSRKALVDLVRSLCVPTPGHPSTIYNILAGWPIACYLTTNYDDEISAKLSRLKTHYKMIGNSKHDLSTLRNDARGLIVKLHSDFKHPDDIVLTSLDYQRLSTSAAGEYFRVKLRSIFEMFDVFILGHSLSDQDLTLMLQVAKETASPQHPIYLIAAGITQAEEKDLFEKYNIVVIPYDNSDGKHARLRQMLSIVDKFVIPRVKRSSFDYVQPSQDEIEAAQSLMIYRRVHKMTDTAGASPSQYLGPLILRTLLGCESGISEAELVSSPPLAAALQNDEIKAAVAPTIRELHEAKLLEGSETYTLSETGRDKVTAIADKRAIEEERAFGEFVLQFKASGLAISDDVETRAVQLLKETLVQVFRQRGLSIANAIFASQSVDHYDLSNIFRAISDAAAQFGDAQLGAAFLESAEIFILQPTDSQLLYLTSLSHGFFLYHLLGLDPTCARTRRDVLAHMVWWCDASVMLPLLAKGSANHEYAKDLFQRLHNVGATIVTTSKFVREMLDHLAWAVRLFETEPIDSSQFMEAALSRGSFSQNLFLDGYIRLAADGKVGTYQEYLREIAPRGRSMDAMAEYLSSYHIAVVEVRDLDGFKGEDDKEVNDLKALIREERERRNSFRNDLQVEAEAEVLQAIRSVRTGKYQAPTALPDGCRTYFLSKSLVLDRVSRAGDAIGWTPEALYRYLLALPGENLDPNLLHKCMLLDYYSAGIILLDRPKYLKFFGPAVSAARASFADEKEIYLREFSDLARTDLEMSFDETPDLEKPFFVSQMAWKVARAVEIRLESERRRADAAEAEVKNLRDLRDSNWKRKQATRLQQLEAERRHEKDPAFLRKRKRQQKKRRRKK